ncbi:MAG TPA: hypothetical protein VNQ53_18300 [Nocardioides sp.]|nr:hypothetical protein [Nocardioides sp.]
MSLYAASSGKRTAQILTDIVYVGWVALCVWLAITLHSSLSDLAEPGEHTASAATSLSESMHGAGDFLGGVPLIGEGVAEPFDDAAAAADRIALAGADTADAVERAAFWLAFTVIVVPIGLASSRYVPARVRFVRESSAGQRFLDARADIELFATRALAHQPLHRLARVSPDPVGAVRRQEWPVIYALADLEIRESGMRMPTAPTAPPRY